MHSYSEPQQPSSQPVEAAIDAIRSFERRMLEEVARHSARASSAERRVQELERESGSASSVVSAAREEAQAILGDAKQQAEALLRSARADADAERRRVADREREFVKALRSYLSEIEEAQATLLRVARRALSSIAASVPTEAELPPPAPDSSHGGHPGAPTAAIGPAEAHLSNWAPPSASQDQEWATPSPGTEGGHGAGPHMASGPDAVVGSPGADTALSGSGRHTTDEHRLIDLHNRLDLDRIHAPSVARSLFRR